MERRLDLLIEVAKQADRLYQFEEIQKDAEGAAEVYPDFCKAIEKLRDYDQRNGLRD